LRAAVVQITVLLLAVTYGIHWAVILLYLCVALLGRRIVVQRLGGITGDLAGAMVEKMELLLLLLLVLIQVQI